MSKVEGRKKIDDSGNTKLLKEVETISKALYMDKNHPKTSFSGPSFRSSSSGKSQMVNSKPKLRNADEDSSNKEKKSIWNWKPLKAFSSVKNRKFNCCFSLVVHSIEGFPSSFEDRSVSVHWKRRDGELITNSVNVSNGVAQFEEKLTHTCIVNGSRSGAHHSAKYEAKHFLLFASVIDHRELDLGKNRVDLTRLLPLTLEELEEEKSSGNWTTSFRLSGEAKGARLNVSFGYTVVGESPLLQGNNENVPEVHNLKKMISGATTSVPKLGLDEQIRTPSESVKDGSDLHEVLELSRSEVANSPTSLVQRIDEHKVDSSFEFKNELSSRKNDEKECGDSEFSAVEHKTVETAEFSLVDSNIDKGYVSHKDDQVEEDSNFDEHEICSKEPAMKESDDALNNVGYLEAEALGYPEDLEKHVKVEIDHETNKNEKSLSLDDATESVANEFLEMLGIEHSPNFGLSSESEPESPRERLLRQFEKDAFAEGYSLFDFDIGDEDQIECDRNSSVVSEWDNLSEEFGNEAENGKPRATVLEDMETEALMREWGLNDKTFQCNSPPNDCSVGFGSPIGVPPEKPLELPSLGEGLGPFLQTKNGGFLRSMNSAIFRNAKAGGSLIMQVSSPVVVPAEMGCGTAEILHQLAAVGIEKLSMQANKLMPLDDITGKTIQQVAWEETASLEGPESHHGVEIGKDKFGRQKNVKKMHTTPGNGIGSEYVSLQDLAPLAMDKIEALSMEGLRVQSGMSSEDLSANINSPSSGPLDIEGAAGLQLLDVKDDSDGGNIEGLMGLSLTLDEWLRFDSGEIGGGSDDEDQISEQTSKILAAHHANSLDTIRSKCEKKRGKGSSSKKCGLMGNNFTVALMVQLHDPSRNYEPVGAPMLALVQVERVFFLPKPKIYCQVSEVRIDDEEEKIEGKTPEEDGIARFCINEVQLAGMKTEPGKNKLWGTTAQQQSGSRWLLANGMGKNNNSKSSFVKSKSISDKPGSSLLSKTPRGDKLWSVSSRVRGAK